MIKIRSANESDLEALLEFEQALIKHERPLDNTLKQTEPIYYYDLPALIASEDAKVLIAESNGEAVGCGFGKIEENKAKFKEKRHGYVGLIFVKEEARRRGIAEEIFEHLFKWFREKDVWETMLRVYPENTGAVKAYEKLGYKTGLIEMKMSLRNDT